MITIADLTVASSARPAALFACWADMATWPEWNLDTEWVRLDGPFATGSTGVLKPKGGPKVPYTLTSVVPDREFVDVSRLVGARLTFAHHVDTPADGQTSLRVHVTLDGPLAFVWNRILGKGIAQSLRPDTERLLARAQAADAAAA
jgi:hypothetical protein